MLKSRKAVQVYANPLEKLELSIWNDVHLQGGMSGQVWLFGAAQTKGTKTVRPWYLNRGNRLELVGSWEIQKEELVLFAEDGVIIGRAKANEDRLVGQFVNADRKVNYGRFELMLENSRPYRVFTNPNLQRLGR